MHVAQVEYRRALRHNFHEPENMGGARGHGDAQGIWGLPENRGDAPAGFIWSSEGRRNVTTQSLLDNSSWAGHS